jgi:hypothetical protein
MAWRKHGESLVAFSLWLKAFIITRLSPADPDSDTTPIVIVKEEIISPGGKKGRTRNVEFPLMPVSYVGVGFLSLYHSAMN